MILVPPNHIMNGVAHVDNCVYDPFTEAATGQSQVSPPPPQSGNPNSTQTPPQNPPPPQPQNIWSVVSEIGDGACGFRAISRRIYGDPRNHSQVRSEVLQYMSDNRNDPDFQNAISSGIASEYLHILGQSPTFYSSYDHYLQIMSHPRAYLGQPEILAASRRYNIPINVSLSQSQLPNPTNSDLSSIQLLYNEHSMHYSSCVLTLSPLRPR